jgi:hypothetical protein
MMKGVAQQDASVEPLDLLDRQLPSRVQNGPRSGSVKK